MQLLRKNDILVNNAGVGTGSPAESMPDEVWEKTIDTNLNGVYYVAREVGKVVIEQNYGKIINIGSIHSTVAMSGSPILRVQRRCCYADKGSCKRMG